MSGFIRAVLKAVVSKQFVVEATLFVVFLRLYFCSVSKIRAKIDSRCVICKFNNSYTVTLVVFYWIEHRSITFLKACFFKIFLAVHKKWPKQGLLALWESSENQFDEPKKKGRQSFWTVFENPPPTTRENPRPSPCILH